MTSNRHCTDEEMNILLCVAKGRQSLGRSMIIDVLRGSHSVRVFSRRLYQISAFGSLREHTEEEVDQMIQTLLDDGVLSETEDEFPRLELTERSMSLMHEILIEHEAGEDQHEA